MKEFLVRTGITALILGITITAFPVYAKEYQSPLFMLEEAPLVNIENALLNDNDPNILIHWGGFGGDVIFSHQFTDVMKILQSRGQKITFILTQTAYSAHADVACSADKIIYNGNDLMFHPLSNEQDQVQNDPISVAQALMLDTDCVKKGILTPKEALEAATNMEVYVTFDSDGKKHTRTNIDPRLVKTPTSQTGTTIQPKIIKVPNAKFRINE